jgi:hypothetical protein
LAGGTVLPLDQTAPTHQSFRRHLGQRREESSVDRTLGLPAGDDSEKATGVHPSLYQILQILSVTIFEKTALSQGFFNVADEIESLTLAKQFHLFEF